MNGRSDHCGSVRSCHESVCKASCEEDPNCVAIKVGCCYRACYHATAAPTPGTSTSRSYRRCARRATSPPVTCALPRGAFGGRTGASCEACSLINGAPSQALCGVDCTWSGSNCVLKSSLPQQTAYRVIKATITISGALDAYDWNRVAMILRNKFRCFSPVCILTINAYTRTATSGRRLQAGGEVNIDADITQLTDDGGAVETNANDLLALPAPLLTQQIELPIIAVPTPPATQFNIPCFVFSAPPPSSPAPSPPPDPARARARRRRPS